MKKLLKDFKEFAFKGNVLDLAVGMMIGSAFTAIVTSVVNDLVMPVITLLTGKVDFSNMFIALDGGDYKTVAQAEEAGAALFKYGNFITAFINFIIIAVVIFLFLKLVVKFKKPAPEPEVTTKTCPYCKSEISKDATKCPFCTSDVK